MAHRKAGGSAKNLRDSKPKYLGIKISDGQKVNTGSIILKQRGTKFIPGTNTALSKDHSIFSKADGIVEFKDKKKYKRFDGRLVTKKIVNVKQS